MALKDDRVEQCLRFCGKCAPKTMLTGYCSGLKSLICVIFVVVVECGCSFIFSFVHFKCQLDMFSVCLFIMFVERSGEKRCAVDKGNKTTYCLEQCIILP